MQQMHTGKELAVWGRAKQVKTGKGHQAGKKEDEPPHVDAEWVKISRLWIKGIWHCHVL
jgi:hypothetical protein